MLKIIEEELTDEDKKLSFLLKVECNEKDKKFFLGRDLYYKAFNDKFREIIHITDDSSRGIRNR